MRCPFCKQDDTMVMDSRPSEDGFSIRRRRECSHCHRRFTTFERAELNLPLIIKRTGAKREYNQEKVRYSMHLALRKRPVTSEKIEQAIAEIEASLRSLGRKFVTSKEVGELVLQQLKKLDSVAYIRFASVYYNVENPEEFKNLMHRLEDLSPAKTSAKVLHTDTSESDLLS